MDVTYRESVLANAEQDASVALFGAENLFSVWQAISTPPISSSLIEEDTTRLITQQVSMAGKMSYFIKLQVATP